jgi:hypothetical protein
VIAGNDMIAIRPIALEQIRPKGGTERLTNRCGDFAVARNFFQAPSGMAATSASDLR